jgi:hypothetical protein
MEKAPPSLDGPLYEERKKKDVRIARYFFRFLQIQSLFLSSPISFPLQTSPFFVPISSLMIPVLFLPFSLQSAFSSLVLTLSSLSPTPWLLLVATQLHPDPLDPTAEPSSGLESPSQQPTSVDHWSRPGD